MWFLPCALTSAAVPGELPGIKVDTFPERMCKGERAGTRSRTGHIILSLQGAVSRSSISLIIPKDLKMALRLDQNS